MKKQGIVILLAISISIILFISYTKAGNKYNENTLLKIGEEKYLKFLWMVDGAFNDSRLDGEYSVNGKKLDKDSKIFTCDYLKNNKLTCVGKNFMSEFSNLFSNNISYESVYGDKLTYLWIKYENDNYYFTNPNRCNINRMNLNQSLAIKEIMDNKVVYSVTVDDNDMHTKINDFVLILENDEWKISKATYYDLCEMEYYIE